MHVHVADVHAGKVLVDGLPGSHHQRVGERVRKVDLAGGERQELLERWKVLGERDLARGEERLQRADEPQLTSWGAVTGDGDQHAPA